MGFHCVDMPAFVYAVLLTDDTQAVSSLGLLQIKWLWAFFYASFVTYLYIISWVNKSGFPGLQRDYTFSFLRNCETFSENGQAIVHFYQPGVRVSLIHTLLNFSSCGCEVVSHCDLVCVSLITLNIFSYLDYFSSCFYDICL